MCLCFCDPNVVFVGDMSCRYGGEDPTGPEQLVLSVIDPLVNVGDIADVQVGIAVENRHVC
jgi:hypothetical protein